MMQRAILVVLAMLLAAGPLSAQGRGKKNVPLGEPELSELADPLIKKLDDPSFKVREAATLDLMELGPKARDALLPAKEHPSPEVRLRVRRILLYYQEIVRREKVGLPTAEDWPTLKRGPGRGASAGLAAVRSLPEIQWFRSLPWLVGSPYFDSPLLAGKDHLFAVSRDGHVTAVNRKSGEIAWEIETGEPVHAGPVMAAGLIYIPGQSLLALDARDGKKVWSWSTDYGVVASPLVHGGLVYAVEKGEKLVALDPANGEEKWKVRLPATSSTPAIVGDLLVLGTTEGVRAVRCTDGQRRWTFKTPAPVTSSPAVLPDRIVIGDSARNLYAISSARGKQIWHRRIPDGKLVETPTVYGDAILFSTSGATFRAMSALDGSDLWTRWVGCFSQSSPCIAGGLVYFTAGSDLFALECANGDDAWRLPLIGGFTSPILVQGSLYVLTLDGVLLCLK